MGEFKMKKILVTGGAGYIGSHVVLGLLDKGYSVRIIDDLSTGIKGNIASEAEFIEGSILSSKDLQLALKGIDAVIHLAAKKSVSQSMIFPESYMQTNVLGTFNLLTQMKQEQIPYLIFSSTAAVYGLPTLDTPISEDMPLNPINFYGTTKKIAEDLFAGFHNICNIKTVSLRFFNAVGYDISGRIRYPERNAENVFPILLDVVFGKKKKFNIFGVDYPTPDGTCVRDYVHVSDLAEAHIQALTYLFRGGNSNIFNLGSQRGISVLQLLSAAEAEFGYKIPWEAAPRRKGDPALVMANNQKAKKILGWVPKYSDIHTCLHSMREIYEL